MTGGFLIHIPAILSDGVMLADLVRGGVVNAVLAAAALLSFFTK